MAKAATKKAAPPANAVIVFFTFERETKGAVRYQETDNNGKPLAIGEGAKIGALYLRKEAFADGHYPPVITVRVNLNGGDGQ